MASEVQIETQQRSPVEVWPPDDSEESIVGTDLHQTTIINLRWGINEVARPRQARAQPVPWQALDQILMRGVRRPDDSEYTGGTLAEQPDPG